jgi:hypothetical protein
VKLGPVDNAVSGVTELVTERTGSFGHQAGGEIPNRWKAEDRRLGFCQLAGDVVCPIALIHHSWAGIPRRSTLWAEDRHVLGATERGQP